MAVMRVHKNVNYTVMSNYHFKEKELSLKAKGLLSLMLSLPDDWDYSIMGLCTLSKDGKDSVMNALIELEQFGYLKRTKIKGANGRFNGYDYDIFEEPIKVANDPQDEPKEEKPQAEKPYAEKPNTENPPQLNTNILNTNLLNKNNKEKIEKREKSVYTPIEPNIFSKELIKNNYIDEEDLYLDYYNNCFDDLVSEYSFDIVRSCLHYFIKQYKNNKEDIENKYGYLKSAMEQNAEHLQNRNNLKEDDDNWLNW